MVHICSVANMTGAELREIRESKGITLEAAAESTCLRPGFIKELEEIADYESIPEVYRKLSFRMYAGLLGVEMETTRRALPADTRRSKSRIVPMTNFVRRMGRPPKPPVLDRSQRNRLLTIAKTTSAAVVVVLAVGLYSLNAKLARLNVDERAEELAARPLPVEAAPNVDWFAARVTQEPTLVLEKNCTFELVPTAPATAPEAEAK